MIQWYLMIFFGYPYGDFYLLTIYIFYNCQFFLFCLLSSISQSHPPNEFSHLHKNEGSLHWVIMLSYLSVLGHLPSNCAITKNQLGVALGNHTRIPYYYPKHVVFPYCAQIKLNYGMISSFINYFISCKHSKLVLNVYILGIIRCQGHPHNKTNKPG